MREKIKTPVVIINKRETSDSYVVSVTDGSNNFHDGVLLVGVKPVEKNDRFAVFSMAGYYMAAEMQIVNLKQNCENDPRIHEIVDLKESVAELAAENVGMKELIEQRANWFQMAQKLGEDLDAAEKRNAEQREYYEGVIADGSKRIAELEARTVVVKQFYDFQIVRYGATEDYAKGYIDCQRNYNKAIYAAGIKVKG